LPSERAILGVRAPGEPSFLPSNGDELELRDGRFAVEVEYSGVSAGTELTFVKGSNPMLHAAFDPELGVFLTDQAAATYPIRKLGYMEVGRVTKSRTPAVATGSRVALACGHRTHHVVDTAVERFVVLPDDLDPLLGIYVAHMGPICANGILHAAADLVGAPVIDLGDGVRGRRVLVTGAGVVGLLTALFAARLGAAEVAIVDRTQARLAAAEALGLWAIDDRESEAWRAVKARWRHGRGDRGADVVFQCRGQDAALASALRCLRPQGTVIDLAFYPGGAPELRLGEEFHHNGLGIRCAQIGRVPRGFAHAWDRERLSAATIELLRARGDDVREHVITDVVPFSEGPELLLALAARERHVIQAVLATAPRR